MEQLETHVEAELETLRKRLDREQKARLDKEEELELLVAAAEAKSVEDAMQTAIDRICASIGWPVGHLYSLDETTGELVSSSVWHLEKGELFEAFRQVSDRLHFGPGRGFVGRILASGKPSWIEDVTLEGNSPVLRAKAAKDIGVRGRFGFPILVGTEVVAVLEFFSDMPATPDQSLLDTMAHFGTQLGRVIERQRMLDRLRKTQDQLVSQQKLASLGSLTAGIAHEIKNPLNFVTNFSEISGGLVDELRELLEAAKERIGPKDFEEIAEILDLFKENVTKIHEHGKRADGIVRNMLMHSRGEIGARRVTNLNALVSEYVKLAYHGMRAQDSNFNVTIKEDYDTSIEPISVIPQDLSRVFLNIAGNACYAACEKAKKTGSGFSPTVTVKTQAAGRAVEVRIRDNGDGIEEAVRQRIFEPFFTTKPAGSGTGLGLSMSYDIVVQEHKGEIRVESEHGHYAEFIITLPRE